MRKFVALLLLPFALQGCAFLAISAVTEAGVSAAEERSFGTKVDDNVVYAAVNDQFVKGGNDGLLISATVNVRHGRVMLTGNMPSEDLAQKAVAAAWKAKGVKEVINELIINPDSTYTQAAEDILVKRNLGARLLITKDVWRINYAIDVINGTAYMLGRVQNRAELNRVMKVARTTKGVKKVVSHLQVASEMQDGAAPTGAAPAAPIIESPLEPPVDNSINTRELSAPSAPAVSAPRSNSPWR